ncbi:HtaR suppressor protein (plasmid) [Neorhizobium galegae bv. officinalis bv. officinalis str. HAMBI 1141]|uniref:HtaR suppressor protein n=1 Tax=Neorhizobium galegae bv. officinalis bv. officinalis str. HAMBI 1141 TaxID=1028801 RepID=A0A068THK8_NEOGA|nr:MULTISPECIES: type II toxin-antitoxin system PrlF family antitoxin [Neorhizobium]MCJ9671918.1 type II toxin-antitoxin system PrlF family antitoxin [Neorhizobium sp. SHOUNA12B]MCJ9747263.1 type II toxin-antitoxin system PrlF family antitoxin [Neorhizobium sp. SHOUNA12A]CDN56980.1 HtaR suppressor protein [Neorhizobium galegae bv. officinalis bv. officinalis str. HAMBI 1141]
MTNVFKEVSTITAKGQTTVPKSVRQALGLDYGDRIAFYVDDERGVSVLREAADAPDPVIDSFLTFLAKDMEARPEALSTLPPALVDRMTALTNGIKVDLDAPIDGEVDL